MRVTVHPWSLPVRLSEVPETGRRFEMCADERTRAMAARSANVVAIERWQAVFELARRGRGGLRVTGAVSATVRQTCVVTLDPTENEVEEAVDLIFDPDPAKGDPASDVDERGLAVSDVPELLVDGVVDLGAVASEFLFLGIDPYPRKAGAVFDAPASSDPGGHPFAALGALRKGQGEGS